MGIDISIQAGTADGIETFDRLCQAAAAEDGPRGVDCLDWAMKRFGAAPRAPGVRTPADHLKSLYYTCLGSP